ncbi:uncharacterized protein LOC130714643 [Lotus japonicus]|uniref:uncharacterized protein LOC130714643 n=1 Tax=Lotus japonicus TaxID=34305 RepID=UPI00258FC2A9|nr:uncharacterized protein LOC130714643 [Lotus japonicus]
MEVREEFMVSPAAGDDSEPTLRTAHFLKPIAIATSIVSETETLSFSSFVSPKFEPKEWPLTVHFNGWRNTNKKWITWVDALRPRYESVWKKVGIFEAIMSTKCYIVKNQNLALGLAEKWCSKTNTFVFPWGEATITLEDVMVLGGYPLLGDHPASTSSSLLENNKEMKEVEERLILARKEHWRCEHGKPSTVAWIDTFINSSGCELEHEAFLATWLSMFVFPHKRSLVNKSLFPIAILLAGGNSIALAPAVLARIYKDLSLLKETMVDLKKNDKLELEVSLYSPFYLVQIWAWERFKSLQPKPNLTNDGGPVLFRWNKVKAMKIDNVRLVLDSAMDKDDFLWRPYVRYASIFEDKELALFVTCVRVSELVGIDSSVMQYFPHRVAMQFGMDQGVPGCVPVFNGTKAIAWENYCRPISDENLYFPSKVFKAGVTARYARWWRKQSALHLHHEDFAKNIVRKKRSPRSLKLGSHVAAKASTSCNDADVPPKIVSNESNDRVSLFGTHGESHICGSENVMELEQRISRLERVIAEAKIARFGHS